MDWINKVRNKPQEEKIRLVWTVVIVAAVVLLGLWIILAHYSRTLSKDTTLFDTLGQGFKDIRDNYRK